MSLPLLWEHRRVTMSAGQASSIGWRTRFDCDLQRSNLIAATGRRTHGDRADDGGCGRRGRRYHDRNTGAAHRKRGVRLLESLR